eukprot:scaffold87487_cov33-Phaeocystis_antarctica.AAC.1
MASAAHTPHRGGAAHVGTRVAAPEASSSPNISRSGQSSAEAQDGAGSELGTTEQAPRRPRVRVRVGVGVGVGVGVRVGAR